MQSTDAMIENIIVAIAGPNPSSRQIYFLRETLRQLVRLSKLEIEADMKRCVTLSVGTPGSNNARRVSKVVTRKILATLGSRQGRLDFQAKVSG